MKKVVLLCVIFAAALASADSINQTYGYTPITTQGAGWGFNNGPNPAIALNLGSGGTGTLQLDAVVFDANGLVSNPYSYSQTQPVYQTYTYSCGFLNLNTCTGQRQVGWQSYG